MKTFLATMVILSMPAAAAAQSAGTVTTDLNMRAGPGGSYEVVSVIPTGAPIEINGCVDAGTWCEVVYDGERGYASASYLTVDQGGTTVVVAEQPSLFETVVVEPVEAVGEAGGAVVGALAGAVGGVVDAVTPDPQVVTYMERNPVDPVMLDGEVVVGAGVPDAVVLQPVPESTYQYAYINRQPVLVDPGSRRIVYVYR